ncbi:MAG: low-specificity L-threonine aldolase [Desulfofustis sp.]|nr:low-specificity L-threonine aldolase [Desulfofustis sp.]
MRHIDLRSDTVTKPTPEMRTAMAEARVGDDVFGDDPTVNKLEETAAAIFGKEAAIFAPSGTQTNLISLLSHCERGDEYIVGQTAHTYRYEAGGAAVLGSIQPQPLDLNPDGTFDLERVAQVIKPDDYHFARSRLLCVENTHNGLALPMEYLPRVADCAATNGLRLHLDGARIFNAAVKCNVEVREIAHYFDSISVCLSKGLGAPVGSLLCGDRQTVARARRWRKMVGGGMRQAGIIAAAGLFALEHNTGRLQVDHDHARLLAEGLAEIDGYKVEYDQAQTNMVFVSPPHNKAAGLQDYLRTNQVLILGGSRIRLVTHLDISREDIHTVIGLFKSYST